MSTNLDIAALRAKLRVYDQSLPRCQKRIVRVSNHAPDYVAEEDRGEWEMRLTYPCGELEGHEGQCREGRAILGWPGFATLTALLDDVERLRANADLAAARLAALLDAERENTALRALLDAKSHEAGLYARRMEQAQRSRDEARADEARRLQLLDDAGGLENEVRELRVEVERLRANHDGLVTTTMEREEFLCAAVEEENRGRCDDRNAVVKYLRVCGHHEAADAISLCGHPLYLCLPAVYTRP